MHHLQDLYPLLPAPHRDEGGSVFEHPFCPQHRLSIEPHAGHSTGYHGGQVPRLHQRLYEGTIRGQGGSSVDPGRPEVSECRFVGIKGDALFHIKSSDSLPSSMLVVMFPSFIKLL